jgi:hypothetical protein
MKSVTSTITATESSPLVLYQGIKCFWRTRITLNLIIIYHSNQQTIEVIAIHEKTKQECLERLYLNASRLINTLDPKEIDEKVKEKRIQCEQSNQHYEISSLRIEVQYQCYVDYILSRLNMRLLSSPPTFAFGKKVEKEGEGMHFEIFLLSLSGDIVNEETKKLEVLYSKPLNLLPFVVSSYLPAGERKSEPTAEETSPTSAASFSSFSSTDCSTISSSSSAAAAAATAAAAAVAAAVCPLPQKRKSSIILSPLLPRRGSIDDSYLNMSSATAGSPFSKFAILSSPCSASPSPSPSSPIRPYTSSRCSLTENEIIAEFREMKENKNKSLLGINGAECFSTNKFSKNNKGSGLTSLKTLTKVIIATKRLSAFNFPSFSINKQKSENHLKKDDAAADVGGEGGDETEGEDEDSEEEEEEDEEPTRRLGGQEKVINSLSLEQKITTTAEEQLEKKMKLSVRHIDDPSVSSFSAIEMLKREQAANGLNRNNSSNNGSNACLRPSTSISSLSPALSRGNLSKMKSTKTLSASSSSPPPSRSPLRTTPKKLL